MPRRDLPPRPRLPIGRSLPRGFTYLLLAQALRRRKGRPPREGDSGGVPVEPDRPLGLSGGAAAEPDFDDA